MSASWETFTVPAAYTGEPDVTIKLAQAGTGEYGKPRWRYEISDDRETFTGDELEGWGPAEGVAKDLAGFFSASGDGAGDSATPAEREFGRRHADTLALYASDDEGDDLP